MFERREFDDHVGGAANDMASSRRTSPIRIDDSNHRLSRSGGEASRRADRTHRAKPRNAPTPNDTTGRAARHDVEWHASVRHLGPIVASIADGFHGSDSLCVDPRSSSRLHGEFGAASNVEMTADERRYPLANSKRPRMYQKLSIAATVGLLASSVIVLSLFDDPTRVIEVGSDPSEARASEHLSGANSGRPAQGDDVSSSSALSLNPSSTHGAEPTAAGSTRLGGRSGSNSRNAGRRIGRLSAGTGETPGDASAAGDLHDRGSDADGSGILEGAALGAALQELLEAEEIGPLQGLLISELTRDGTRFTAEHVPNLFDALMEVDDFGLEQLVLTHLERIEGAPEQLVDGYLEYLDSSKRPHHSEAVFERLGDIGGEAAITGLSDLVRTDERGKLRHQAADALAEIKDPRGVDAIRDVLLRDAENHGARSLMESLARFEAREALDVMIEYGSKSGNEHALGAFRSLRSDELAGALADSLRGRSSEAYTRMAIKKLGEFADPATIPSLERILDRGEGVLPRDAVMALGRFRDAGAAEVLESYSLHPSDPRIGKLAAKFAAKIHTRLSQPSERRQEPRLSRIHGQK